MIDEELEEQASLYLLGMLEPDELRDFESALAANAELQRRVDELRETVAKIAHGAPLRMPPAGLEARILRAIEKDGGRARAAPSSPWLPWALAACLTVACVLLAVDRIRIRREVSRLEQRDEFAQMQIATLSSKLENAPKAAAVVLWDAAKQQGILKTVGVPPNGDDRDYQLWVVDPKYKQPVDAGVFSVAREGTTKISFKPKSPITSADGFAISLERKGGVRKAEGPIVLMGK